MQKNYSSLVIKFLLLTFIVLPAIIFSSCKNFLDAKEVKQEIIDYIEYCNATECTLYISQDSSTGVFLSSAKQKCRVGYTTELQVTVNRKNYVFQTLSAVSINDLSQSRQDYLEFTTETIDEEKGIYKIIIKLLKEAHDILICPVCSLIPKITGVTPAIETSGCEQDLEIKVSFNKEMDKESFGDFSCLKITSDGDDLTSLFATPFFTGNGKTLVITPLCASQSEDFSSSFLLEPSGTVNTRKITVEFNFTGDQKDKEGIPITGISEYTYKVNKNLSQNELPSMKVEITGDSGDFTPTIGIKDCIKTYTYQLSFRPYDDYEFIRWKIFDKVYGTEISNGTYITIENPAEKNTTYSFTELPEDDSIKVAVEPVVVERPEIYSWSPIKTPQNTYKDTMIQFTFDYEMDPSSIYYSLEEIKTIHNYENIAYENFLPAVTQAELAGGDAFKENYHYGYKKGTGVNEEYIYKNISITLQDGGRNMNKCFDAPVFEGKRMVTIPSSPSDEVEFPNYAVVQVTINKNFCYMKDGIPVTMKKSKIWTYQVNTGKDKDPPDINNIKVAFSGTSGRVITEGECPTVPWQTGDNNIYNKEQKLGLKLSIHDVGIGPADKFTLVLEKVLDNNYGESSKIYEKSINFISISTTDAIFEDTDVDFSDLKLDDGVYRTSFIFRDKSGNPLYHPAKNTAIGYYFTVDNAIEMDEPVVTDNSDGEGGKLKLDWTPRPDWKKTKIRWKKKGTSQWSAYDEFTNASIHSKQYNFAGLETLTSLYDFEIINYDLLDHSQTINITRQTAGLASISITGTPEKTLYLAEEPFDKTGLTVTAKLTNNNSWILDDYSTDLGNAVSLGKTVKVIYTLNGDTKDAEIQNAKYYVAASNALTKTPIKTDTVEVQVRTGGTLQYPTYGTKDVDLYNFGDFPQTIAEHQEDSYYMSQPIYNGWYLGNDGYFYEKCRENGYDKNTKYSNGVNCQKYSANSYKYFKVEPISWRVLENNQSDQTLLLFANKVLVSSIKYYPDASHERDFPNEKIQPNNYQYSAISAYLNGNIYEVYDSRFPFPMPSEEYFDKGLLQKAFALESQSYILVTYPDNSVTSTLPYYYDECDQIQKQYNWNNGANPYANNSYDPNNNRKLFLLSVRDITNWEYACSAKKLATDYAIATGIKVYSSNNSFGGYYLRSPHYNQNNMVYYISDSGVIEGGRDNSLCDISYYGVVPAMRIILSPQP
ncbi:MAG: hypothetical protein J5687_00870 [Treponema sp.]|nr:hypothetical protein [Treponema sp.]